MTVDFTNFTTGVVNSYHWNFGDGQTSTETDPSHTYQDKGDYDVRLTANGPDYTEFIVKSDYVQVGKWRWWATTYRYPELAGNHEEARAMAITPQGAHLVAGQNNGDVWVLKLNADKSVLWDATYGDGGGPGTETAHAIKATADGGCIVAGTTDTYGAGGRDVWVLRLNPDGAIAWQNTYGGSAHEEARALDLTADGGIIVAGESNNDAWVLKLNPDGTVAWQKTYGDPAFVEKAYAVQQTDDDGDGFKDDGYIVAGENNDDAWVLKLNPDGTVAWQKAYGDVLYVEKAYAVKQTDDDGDGFEDDGYMVAGENSDDAWVLKLNQDGTLGWHKTYGGAGADRLHAVLQTADGGYAAAGSTASFGAGAKDAWIVRLSPDDQPDLGDRGEIVWQKTYGGSDDDEVFAMELTLDGDYVAAGLTESFGGGVPGSADTWVMRVDQYGEINDCDLMSDSTALPVDPLSITPIDTTVSTADTLVTPSNTTVTPQATDAFRTQSCNESVVPAANFTADPPQGPNPLTVQFTDLSAGNITSYLWNFGDGDDPSTERNPAHKFKGKDFYSVKLTVAGPAGQDVIWSNELFGDIWVTDGLPIAKFKADQTVGTGTLLVNLEDQSSDKWGDIQTYQWHFGDGDSAMGQLATHVYDVPDDGAFDVSLTATGPGGSNTRTKVNFIHGPNFYPLQPVIEDVSPNKPQPGEKITITGYNFGESQGDSLIHVNGKIYDASSRKVRFWSDTKIKVKLKNYKCGWFKKNTRLRKIWVTVDGNDSLIYDNAGVLVDKPYKIKVYKPGSCP
jgi:uncharacterized delta-60 repeat protein